MSFRDRLRPGSFRGAAFFTPSSEREGGRRGSVHEYPGSDVHTTQDLGKAVTRFSVTAICLGPDYDIARDALIRALEQGGAGKLVHRYYGEFDAELEPGKTYRVVETEADGGKATFTIPFIRASKTKAASIGADSAQLVKIAAAKARTAAKAKFDSDLDTSGPEFVRDAIVNTLNAANSAVAKVNRQINGALAITSGVQGGINALGNNLAHLVSSPLLVFELSANVMAIQAEMFESIVKVGDSLKAVQAAFRKRGPESAAAETEARKIAKVLTQSLEGITTIDEQAVDDTTSLNAQMALNQLSALQLVKNAGAIEASVAALSLPYDSQSTANTTRDMIADALDTLAQASTSDDVYGRLTDLRVALHQHLTLAAGSLPRAAEYVPRTVMPALLIAHLVHGDARRCEEIIARNNIRHPGFVPVGTPVQVLDA